MVTPTKKTLTKQVLVVRRDLKMRKGKIGAQCAHASMMVLLNSGGFSRSLSEPYQIYTFPLTTSLAKWLSGDFTKVCVYVDSEADLKAIHQKALAANVPTALCVDSGKTEFHGVPTPTVVAVGPDWVENIDPITGGLPLY